MRKGTPDQFIRELEEKIVELKGEDVESSTVIIDDEEDVIEADENVEDFRPAEGDEDFEEEFEVEEKPDETEVKTITVESAPKDEQHESEEGEAEEDSSSEYLTGLYKNVEQELNDLIQSVAWSTDEDNIYMDVNFSDGHIFTFTIPKADLSYDIQNQDKDIQYICLAVRDTQEPEESKILDEVVEDEPYNMEDYYSEEDRPAYL